MKTATMSSASVRFLCTLVLFAGLALPVFGQANDSPYDNTKGLELYPPGYAPRVPPHTIEVITAADGYDNFDVGVDNAEQHISANPNNPMQIVFGVNGASGSTWRHTEDGALNWATQNPPGTNSGDPWTAYDSLGNIYIQFLSGTNNPVWRSTNNGATWSGGVPSAPGNDRNTMAVDMTSGPYAGYLYAGAWGVPASNCQFARSTDFGATWTSTLTTANNVPGNMIAVGANVLNGQNVQGGCVYFVSTTGNAQATTYNFFRSTNGGGSFDAMSSLTVAGYVGTLNTAGRLVINNARTRPYPMITADNSNGPYRGRLYLAYASNEPAGNGNKPDIFFQYSTDQGATWTARSQTINDNPNPTATNEWYPFIWCDKNTGRLYAKWYDMRDDLTNQRAWVYGTYSDDGGQTFATNVRLSNADMPYPGIPCTPNTNCYRGDYDCIVSAGSVAIAVWTDFRNNTYQNMLAYFPDFAMQLSQSGVPMTTTDSTSVQVKVPSVKYYTGTAKFSATVSPPAPFTLSFEGGRDSLTAYPDSVALHIRTNNVPTGTYTVTVVGRGPGGTPVHRRTITVTVNYLQQGWTAQTSGVGSYLYSVKAVNQSAAWTAGANGVVLRTTNGGLNWSSVGGGRIGTATVYNIDALNDSVAFVTTTPGTSTYIFRTTNRGVSWDTVYAQAGGFIDAIRMSNANNGFALGDPVDTLWTVLRTIDGGASWFRIATQPPQVGGETGTQNGMTIYVPPVGQVQIWFTSGVGGRVYHSADAGVTWSSGSSPFAATSNVWFNGSQNGFVTGSTADSLARTTDGGATWSSVPVSGSGFLIACSGSGLNDFWYARGNTIFRSTDRGVSFAPAYTGTGTYVGLSFATSGTGTFGWAVTSTGGIAAFNGTITSVPGQQQPPVSLPEHITLMQNYPNPFNPSTTIAFAVPASSLVTIRVYDILGREVRTLLNGVQNAGQSQVTWDGTNNSDARAASGIYYYRLETSLPDGTTQTSSRKMLLLK